MDLEEKLKQSSDLYKSLKEIEEFCNKTWRAPLLPWFTNHDVLHSKEIIHLLGQILSPIENTPASLTEHELFILLASAYLHDIGMQYLKVENISVDKLNSDEYEIIRKRHAEESYNIILKSVQKSLDRDDFHLPEIEEQYLVEINPKKVDVEYFCALLRGTTEKVTIIDKVIIPFLDRKIQELNNVECAVLKIFSWLIKKDL